MKTAWNTTCILGLFVAVLQTGATPQNFGSNYYEFVQVAQPFEGSNNAWMTAKAAASASVYNGLSGHLATVASQAENDFLHSLVVGTYTGFNGAWLGGKSPEGWLAGPETGQGFSYGAWSGGEPNNSGYAYMNIGTSFAGIGPGRWADDSGDQGFPNPYNDPVIGYFIEYEGQPTPPSLMVRREGAGIILSWPNTGNYTLQQNTNLALTTNWTAGVIFFL